MLVQAVDTLWRQSLKFHLKKKAVIIFIKENDVKKWIIKMMMLDEENENTKH